jgi:hypothetical protein
LDFIFSEKAPVQHLRNVAQTYETGSRARDFLEIVKAAIAGRGFDGNAVEFAQGRKMSPRVMEFLKAGPSLHTKASAGTVNGWGAGLVDFRLAADAYLASNSQGSAFDKILAANGFRLMPRQTRVVVTSVAGSAQEVAEGGEKPTIDQLDFDAVNLAELKACAILVVTEELARLGGVLGERVLDAELRSAIGRATDQVFVGVIAATVGVQTPATGGAAYTDVLSDLTAALAIIGGDSRSKYFAVVRSELAAEWSLMAGTGGLVFPQLGPKGGFIGAVEIVTSDGLGENMKMIVCDGNAVMADPGELRIEPGRHAAIDLGEGLVDAWGNNLAPLRADRHFSVKLLRPTAAVIVENEVTA